MFEKVLLPGTTAYYWDRRESRESGTYEVLGPVQIAATSVKADGTASYELRGLSPTITVFSTHVFATQQAAYLDLARFLREEGERYKERRIYEALMFEMAAEKLEKQAPVAQLEERTVSTR